MQQLIDAASAACAEDEVDQFDVYLSEAGTVATLLVENTNKIHDGIAARKRVL